MTFPYVVQRGDTLYRIARRFAINMSALQSANPQIENFDYIVPGQVIQIPVRRDNLYVIQAGDTFYRIAQRFNIALNDLIAANPNVDPTRLQIGQTIVLPISVGETIVDTTGPYGYDELVEDIGALGSRYPFLQTGLIGESVLGRKIPVIIFGRGPKTLHYNGSFHANEWITTPLLMKFVEELARAFAGDGNLRGTNVHELYDQVTLWIVPMVNPDGVELVLNGITPDNPFYDRVISWNNGSFNFQGWKANIRGVDLNDQFPANWEVEKERRSPAGPAPRDYVGEAPLTEPEAIAIAALTQNEDFRLVIAFHTQGEVIFWNYRDLEPPESEQIVNRFQQVSGYTPMQIFNSDAGYKDWFIQDFRRPGFTVEAGRGVNPLPISQFPQIYEDVVGIMLEGMKAAQTL